MKSYAFKKIDAFAGERSGGNPAGYVRLDSASDISADEMLRIARELKGFVTEVGFLAPMEEGKFALKYYSSEREVDFCGHATIAIAHDLFSTEAGLADKASLRVVTNRGELRVLNKLAEDGSVYIMAPEPFEKSAAIPAERVAMELGLSADDIDPGMPISILNAGLTTLIVPLKSLEAALGARPRLEELKAFCIASEVDIIEIFSRETSSTESDYRARVFAPTFGYLEDPATGSGNSAFGFYLLRNGLWKGEGAILIEQNGERRDFNRVRLITIPDAGGKPRVYFGGRGVTRIEGRYFLGAAAT